MSGFLDRYVRTAKSPSLASIRAALWNDLAGQPPAAAGAGAATPPATAVPPTSPTSPETAAALLEQYKLYVEMTDRISARRGGTNTFFLTLNTTAVTAIGLLWSGHLSGSRWILAFLFVGLIVQCMAWFWLLRSYRQLNTVKYAVIGVLEERLPASPYWSAEWTALGEGADPRLYWPLSHLEQLIPTLFVGIYVFGFILGMIVK